MSVARHMLEATYERFLKGLQVVHRQHVLPSKFQSSLG